MRNKAKRLTDHGLPTFQWVPVKGAKRSYELRSGTNVVGRMRWPQTFGSLAEAEFGDDHWTFKRGGFLRPRVTVRSQGANEDSAVLELSFGGGGLLRIRDGRCLRWIRQGFWSQRFAFADEKGVELVLIEPKFGIMRRSGAVRTAREASSLRELALLILVGWYVTMLIADDDAAAVAVCCG